MRKSYNVEKDRVYLSCSIREFVGLIKKQGTFHGALPITLQEELTEAILPESTAENPVENNVHIKAALSFSNFTLLLSGQIESVEFSSDGYNVILTRKITRSPAVIPSPSPDHYHLSLLYAFCLLQSRGLDKVGIKIRYIHRYSGEDKLFLFTFSRDQMTDLISPFLLVFSPYGDLLAASERKKNEGCLGLRFPYKKPREGQLDMIREVYDAIREKRTLFCNAPTGIGKTVAVLYPALKALGRNRCDRVFYLTSKGTVQKAVMHALIDLWGEKPFVRTLFLTAKERICLNRLACRDGKCARREGYYTRVGDARLSLLAKDQVITSSLIQAAAKEYGICPFALSLDLIPYCDLVVCDYNYFFDVSPLLLPFARKCENAVLLIDEAHNLPKRVCDSYSAKLDYGILCDLRELITRLVPDASMAVEELCLCFSTLLQNHPESNEIGDDAFSRFVIKANFLHETVFPAVRACFSAHDDGIADEFIPLRQALLTAMEFFEVANVTDGKSSVHFDEEGVLNIVCIDPSDKIRTVTDLCGSAIFFSATLLPEVYFERMFALREEDLFLSVPSPYDSDQLLLLHWPLPQTYSARKENIGELLSGLKTVHDTAGGNVLVFFPSYEYLSFAVSRYREFSQNNRILVQTPSMTYDERNLYLRTLQLNDGAPYMAFAVMGGFFSESIDLVGDSLQGVVIVGCGMPPASCAGGKVAAYFSREDENGIGFAYHYPTINRILQAAGRVIRSENDRGFLLLCDERFGDPLYEQSFPAHWNEPIRVLSCGEIRKNLVAFLL